MTILTTVEARLALIETVLLADLEKLTAAGNVKPALAKLTEIIGHLLHLHRATTVADVAVDAPVTAPAPVAEIVAPAVIETVAEVPAPAAEPTPAEPEPNVQTEAPVEPTADTSVDEAAKGKPARKAK